MRRREFMGLLGGAAAAWPFAARAQVRDRAVRVGFLLSAKLGEVDACLAGLHDLGWVQGSNLQVEYRFADGDDRRLPALAAELAALNVDVIVTGATGVFAARRATASIPIVAGATTDLVAAGLAASLAHPGGNVTGQTFFHPQLISKRLEMLKAVTPSLARAAVVMVRGSGANPEVMRVVSATATTLSVELRPIEVGGPGEFEAAFPDAETERVGGFLTTDHPLFIVNAEAMTALALTRGLPWIGSPDVASRGAMIGYGVDILEMFRHAAIFVDKILKGAKPADIPIEQATKFKTIINLKTAKALGVEIPPTLFASADEVIE
jgi:putative ABC transport system substrate-binding protein